MSPTELEIKAIKCAELMYTKRRKGWFARFFKKPFQFNDYKSSPKKTLSMLWQMYGLADSKEFQFTKEDKLTLINEWYSIFYPHKLNITERYLKMEKEYFRKTSDYTNKNPYIHVSWVYPTPESYLDQLTEQFGPYDQPKQKLNELSNEQLHQFGMEYVKEHILKNGYTIVRHQQLNHLPQFVLQKNGIEYFMYVRFERSPFDLKKLFSNEELTKYIWLCQKRNKGLLIAGIVFSNANNEFSPLYEDQPLSIDFTGIVDMLG